jgi:hypothetical protein
VNDYFDGAINHLIERGQHLIAMIPTGLPPELLPLERICRDKLADKLDELKELATGDTWIAPENQPERLRQFRRLIRGLDIIETVCIAALERANLKSDLHLNRLVERIRQEIRYPLPPPVVAPLSQAYFRTWPDFHLMLVPLSEGDFLLHLPDIYHELGHPLFYERYDPKIKPFSDALLEAVDEITTYIEGELDKENRRGGPERLRYYLELWLVCWLRGWAEEFFCDLFAVCTLGPAFVWSHFHLAATRGEDPYEVPLGTRVISHPADGARMSAMLEELTLIGFSQEAAQIEGRWNLFVAATQTQIEPEYLRCFPGHLMRMLAQKALQGVEGMKCRVAAPETKDFVHRVFNGAWAEFWRDPVGYVSWEKEAVESLKNHCQTAV